MKLLLDTHTFLWFLAGDPRLSRPAIKAIENSDEWWLSTASVWEIAVKASLGRVMLPSPALDYISAKVREGLQVLPIEWPHAAAVERLPMHHRDPFDRLIVAQAQRDRLVIVTKDRVFKKYGVDVIW